MSQATWRFNVKTCQWVGFSLFYSVIISFVGDTGTVLFDCKKIIWILEPQMIVCVDEEAIFRCLLCLPACSWYDRHVGCEVLRTAWLFVCLLTYLKNRVFKLYHSFCTWYLRPWLGGQGFFVYFKFLTNLRPAARKIETEMILAAFKHIYY